VIRSLLAALFPSTYVAAVTGGPDVASEVTRLPLDHLLFTGSTRVGRLVMKAASENLVPVTLELGGKSPAIVHPEYPFETAAERILTGKLYNAGQTCVAPDYVLVPDGRTGEFVTAAKKAIARMYPTLAGNPDYTRIVNRHHYERLTALVADARQGGAEILTAVPAGEACHPATRTFPPTLVVNVRDDMSLVHEEIFGPILPIVEYRTLDDALAYVEARPRPLALYYFDNHRSRVHYVLQRSVSGGVTVNDCVFHVGQPGLPFGGIGPSGMGRYHGFDGFQTFSHKKGVLLQGRWSPLSLLRPPYGARARRILDFLLR
jgi:coniferyl-aldehyde dehydrogenase